MKTRLFTQIGGFGLLSVSLLAGTVPAPDNSASFSAVLTGAVKTTISGDARFGQVRGGPSAPDVFSLTLGADSSGGAVLFTRPAGSGLHVRSYRVAEAGARDGELQALVVLGSANHPEGVFRATAGTLTITSVSDFEITGLFSVDADGFLASAPDRENQPVSVSGSFIARRSNWGF
jgi:hypothetical protein